MKMNKTRQIWDISVGYETPIKISHESRNQYIKHNIILLTIVSKYKHLFLTALQK